MEIVQKVYEDACQKNQLVCNDVDFQFLEWNHAQNYIRSSYVAEAYQSSNFDILAGQIDFETIYHDQTHPAHKNCIPYWTAKYIKEHVPIKENEDWDQIRKNIKGGVYKDSPNLLKHFAWLSNIHGLKTEIPPQVYVFASAIRPYFGKRTPHMSLMLVYLLKVMGLPYGNIPLKSVGMTRREYYYKMDFIMGDFDETGFKFNDIPKRQRRKWKLPKSMNKKITIDKTDRVPCTKEDYLEYEWTQYMRQVTSRNL